MLRVMMHRFSATRRWKVMPWVESDPLGDENEEIAVVDTVVRQSVITSFTV